MFAPDVIGLGIAVVDVVLSLERMPRWDDPGMVSGFALADGGPAGTACAVAATLGVRAGFIDTVGNDEMAARKLHSLEHAGVDISHIISREAPEDHVVIVYVQEKTGERYFSFLRGFLSQSVQPEELDRDYLTSARYLHLDGCHPKAALQASRWMHGAGKSVVLDAASTSQPVPEYMQALVAETDVLICGSGFGTMLTGHRDLWQSGRALLDIGPHIVVQTEGVNGSYTVSPDDQFHTPAFEVDVIDTTGAGDVFHGAYLVGLVRGWDLRRIATFASAVAAIHCTTLGNRKGIPSMQEVEEFLRERG
ncbi:MAG TPA: carbohydrate kinase family protein [Dehalococcoidia bacterium]|nr:carbohydrate kinase family protein [Dehalococcoidia bacterium]